MLTHMIKLEVGVLACVFIYSMFFVSELMDTVIHVGGMAKRNYSRASQY